MRLGRPALALTLALATVAAGCGGDPASTARRASPAPEATPTPFTRVVERGVLERSAMAPAGRWKTARVFRRTQLRATPGGRVIATIGPRTEFGSPRVLGVTGRRDAWLRVVATERRNGRAAWIPAAAAKLGATNLSVHVDRSARRLELRRGGRALARFAVAVGRPGTETPLGRFAVTDKLHPRDPGGPYGCCAIALSGHQTKLLPGWPGGDRLAIHATPDEDSVGRAASLGCLRARGTDVRRLMRRLALGTPVFIRA